MQDILISSVQVTESKTTWLLSNGLSLNREGAVEKAFIIRVVKLLQSLKMPHSRLITWL